MSRLCLVLNGKTNAENLAILEQNKHWIDMAEVRADCLDPAEWAGLRDFSRRAELELILTLRMKRDGGFWEGSVQERASFFKAALSGRWTWWDIEDDRRLPEIEAEWLSRGGKLVVSFHDFTGVPPLAERLRNAQGPASLVKAAVYPRSSKEFLRFLQETQALPPGQKVVLAMGPFGFSSRVLAEQLGSAWTYASPMGNVAAPGQVDPATLAKLYHFASIGTQTQLFGVIGNPIHHSKSPAIHNAGYEALGLDAVYLPFLVDDLEAFFQTADLLHLRGFSVTLPFKQDVIRHLVDTTPAVQASGACNTVWKDAQGWHGDNTDAEGFLAPLKSIWGTDFSDKRVTVVGTGGAARSVVWALRQSGATVLVLGRSPAKAEALAREFGVDWGPLSSASLADLSAHDDLIVQTTSLGMGEQEGVNPLDWYEFTGNETAYDIVYNPEKTAFLQAAESAGCRLVLGKDMLLHQAIGQFSRFVGQDFPETLPF
jgi:3-dehydroquinate dehydratase/shikimate dehydrogenase